MIKEKDIINALAYYTRVYYSHRDISFGLRKKYSQAYVSKYLNNTLEKLEKEGVVDRYIHCIKPEYKNITLWKLNTKPDNTN